MATVGQTTLAGMFGLNADPTTDQNYTSLDYAWSAGADGKLYIVENGTQVDGNYGNYATSDVLEVAYDGGTVRYLVNGVVKYSVATTANRSFYFDSSFNHTGFALNNIQFRPLTTESFYEYDAGGNRTRERTVKNGITYQDARTAYDALGRMTQVGDNLYSLSYRYDAAGNRRRAVSSYYDENNALKATDNWYLYDGMNRITLSQGGLVNGGIVSNPSQPLVLVAGGGITVAGNSATKTGAAGWGTSGAYSTDALTGNAYVSATAGQTNLCGMFGLNADPAADNNYTSLDYAWYLAGSTLYIYENGGQIGSYGSYPTTDALAISYDGSNVRYLVNGVVKRTVSTTANRTLYFDSSFYDTNFRLDNIRFEPNSSQGTVLAYDAAGNRRQATRYESGVAVTEAYTYDTNNRLVSTNKSGNLTGSRSYDAAGRVTEQVSYSSPGAVSERRANTYNANGWLTQQDIKNGADTLTQRMTYSAYDALGNVKTYQVQVLTGTAYTNTYTTTYAKYDGYKEEKQAGTSTYFQAGATTSSYDVNGNLTAVSETFATSKNRSFVTDAAGHILQKTENGKTQNYFYANDKPLGSSGALGAADFDFNYTPVSAQYPASTPGSYVVSAGDTLRGIALAVFGDAQLWYLIADANGLKSDADLTAGRNLTIPNKVTNLRNAADTYKPYAPGAIIGDTTPTLPDPPPPPPIYSSSGGGGCGGFGAILVAVIAIVAVVMTAGALAAPMASVTGGTFSLGMSALGAGINGAAIAGAGAAGGLGFAGFAIAGAVGSIASQAVGMAIGVQEEFSWGAVAMGALSSVAGGAASNIVGTSFGPAGGFGNMVARAVVGSVIRQGVGVAVGLQKEFSWSGVAAAGVGAGLSSAVAGSSFGKAIAADGGVVGNGLMATLTSGTAHALVFGGKVNWTNVAADAFGNAIANSLGYRATAVGNAQQVGALDTAGADSERYSGGGLKMPTGLDNPLGLNLASLQESRYSSPSNYLPMDGLRLPMTESSVTAADNRYDDRNWLRSELVANNRDDSGQPVDPFDGAFGDKSLSNVYFQKTPDDKASLYASNDRKNFGYYGYRFGQGLLGALDSVTRQPILQVRDMAAAGASVFYNEVLRSNNQPMWFPEMRSGIAHAYASGTSQTELLLASNFVTGTGVLTYSGTRTAMEGKWGDLTEMAGGVAGGFAVGKVVAKYGGYGLAFEDIGATGPFASQAGIVRLRIVSPAGGPVEFTAPPGATAAEVAQIQRYIELSNQALDAGALSSTGRVTTAGAMRQDASRLARLEGRQAASEGVPYAGHVGHVPDTTWTGNPKPYTWLDLTPRVNMSLGGQASSYPVGYKPTTFVFKP